MIQLINRFKRYIPIILIIVLLISVIYFLFFKKPNSPFIQESVPLTQKEKKELLEDLNIRVKRVARYADQINLSKKADLPSPECDKINTALPDISKAQKNVLRAAKYIDSGINGKEINSKYYFEQAESAVEDAEEILTGFRKALSPEIVRFPAPDQVSYMMLAAKYFAIEAVEIDSDKEVLNNAPKCLMKILANHENEVKNGETSEKRMEIRNRAEGQLFKLLRYLKEPKKEHAIYERTHDLKLLPLSETAREKNKEFINLLNSKLPSVNKELIAKIKEDYSNAGNFYSAGHYNKSLQILNNLIFFVSPLPKGNFTSEDANLILSYKDDANKCVPLPGIKPLNFSGKLIEPENKGMYISLWGLPIWGNGGFTADVGEHFPILGQTIQWIPGMRGTSLFDYKASFNNEKFELVSLNCADNNSEMLLTTKQYFDTFFNIYGAAPLLFWGAWIGGGWSEYFTDTNLPESVPRIQDIIDGKYDDYIKKFATELKAWSKPVVIELNQELNGDALPTSAGRAFGEKGDKTYEEALNPNKWWQKLAGYKDEQIDKDNPELLKNQYGDSGFLDGPERARDMLKHVHDIFDEIGVSNVSWATHFVAGVGGFFANTPEAEKKIKYQGVEWKNFWPGNNYIDWGGSSAYFSEPGQYDEIVKWSYDDYRNSAWRDTPFGNQEFHFNWLYDSESSNSAENILKVFNEILPSFGISWINLSTDGDVNAFSGLNKIGNVDQRKKRVEAWRNSVVNSPRYRPYPEFHKDTDPPAKVSGPNVKISSYFDDNAIINLSWLASADNGSEAMGKHSVNRAKAARKYIIKTRSDRYKNGIDFVLEPYRLWSDTDSIEFIYVSEKTNFYAGDLLDTDISLPKGKIYYIAVQAIDSAPYNSRISDVAEINIP